MKFVKLLLCAALLSGSTTALVSAPADAGTRYHPRQGGIFNVPRGTTQKEFRVQAQVVKAINHARRGSVIKISVFSWDRKVPAYAIRKAKQRGVKIQILLNDHQVTPAQRLLHQSLGTNRWHKNFAYECRNGCRSRGENLHTKFYLFSHTGGARDVVMTGSANLTTNGAVNQYNDLYIRNGVPRVYNKFNNLFQEMRKDKVDRTPYWVQNVGKHYSIKAAPYPNFSAKRDPIMKMLNNVKCTGARGGTGNKVHHTMIRVVMHTWNDRRGIYLAQKVRRMFGAGCDVKVIYGYAGEEVRKTFATRTTRGYMPVHTSGKDTNNDGFIDLYTHQKELLISGYFGKDRSSRIVVTGSSNWNDEGLRGDEEIFWIKRDGAHRDYSNNFTWFWNNRSTLVKYIPYRNSRTSATLRPEDVDLKRFGPAWEAD